MGLAALVSTGGGDSPLQDRGKPEVQLIKLPHVFYSLLSTDTSVQIAMPVHSSVICTLGNKGRRQDPPLSRTFTAGKASRSVLHPKPLHVVLNLPHRDRDL